MKYLVLKYESSGNSRSSYKEDNVFVHELIQLDKRVGNPFYIAKEMINKLNEINVFTNIKLSDDTNNFLFLIECHDDGVMDFIHKIEYLTLFAYGSFDVLDSELAGKLANVIKGHKMNHVDVQNDIDLDILIENNKIKSNMKKHIIYMIGTPDTKVESMVAELESTAGINPIAIVDEKVAYLILDIIKSNKDNTK